MIMRFFELFKEYVLAAVHWISAFNKKIDEVQEATDEIVDVLDDFGDDLTDDSKDT